MSTGEKSFLVRWTPVTTLGFVLLLTTIGAAPPLIAGGLAGLTLGIAQWLVLRQRAAWAYEWIIATAIGFPIAIVAIDRFANVETTHLPPFLYTTVVFSALGVLIGTRQWLVLRRHLLHTGSWIPTSTMSYLLIVVIVIVPSVGIASMDVLTEAVLSVVIGLVVGTITGIAMVRLLWYPTSTETPYGQTSKA